MSGSNMSNPDILSIENGRLKVGIPSYIVRDIPVGQQIVVNVGDITITIRSENIPLPTIILPTVVLADPYHEIIAPSVTTISDDAENAESVINEVVVAPIGSRENPIVVN